MSGEDLLRRVLAALSRRWRVDAAAEQRVSFHANELDAVLATHPDALHACGGWLDVGPFCGLCERCRAEGRATALRLTVNGRQN